MCSHVRIALRLVAVLTMIVECACETEKPYHSLRHSGDVEKGRQEYQSLVSMSKLPRYGKCWKNALKELHVGCDSLTDDSQSLLALQFTNCFLEKAGHKTYPCSSTEQHVSNCTKSMDTTAFHTFTTFFTHTQNMCHFIKSQVWYEAAENTISELLDASSEVKSTMVQHLQLQKESLENEKRMLHRGEELVQAIESSKAGVNELMHTFHDSTSYMFERVVKFHSLVVGEFVGVYSIVFLLVALCVSYLITSTKRTSSARFCLFSIVLTNFVAEKMATNWRLHESVLMNADNAQDAIYDRIWLIRKTSCCIAAVTLTIYAYRYRDLNVANFELLQRITQQNTEIASRLARLDLAVGSFKGQSSTDSDEHVTTTTSSDELSSSGSWSPSKQMPQAGREMTAQSQHLLIPALANNPDERSNHLASRSEQSASRLSPYNLRPRSPNASLNPLTNMEDSQSFAATVHRLATISKRNSLKVRHVLKREKTPSGAQFSSDDEL